MCLPLTPVLFCVSTILIEVYPLCFIEAVRLRVVGKPTSRAELSTPNSLYFKAVKGAHFGSNLLALLYGLLNNDIVNMNYKSHRCNHRIFGFLDL